MKPLSDQAVAAVWRLLHEANERAEQAWADYDAALARARQMEDVYWLWRDVAARVATGPTDGD